MSDPIRVEIYSRPGCHLCDEAKAVIQRGNYESQFTLVEVNIETDPRLVGLYANDIPVITINDSEVFLHRVSAEQFAEALKRAG